MVMRMKRCLEVVLRSVGVVKVKRGDLLVGFWNSIPLPAICILLAILAFIVLSSSTLFHDNAIYHHTPTTKNPNLFDQQIILDQIDKLACEPEIKVVTDPLLLLPSSSSDTMEATWKAITGGGIKLQQRKNLHKTQASTPKWRDLKKSITFNDSLSLARRGGLSRNDPSITRDQFNKQVEDFINKTNDKMRLERLQSQQQKLFDDMIPSSF